MKKFFPQSVWSVVAVGLMGLSAISMVLAGGAGGYW
jgi:hypothetical protein